MFGLQKPLRDDSLITSLSQQQLISRILNEVSEVKKSSSDELFMTVTMTMARLLEEV